ncbi:MAG: hypothetical protein OER88_02560 [Planctomycetota bacterium]|nr:hypothetical protein [Planctomycetota bacterium]
MAGRRSVFGNARVRELAQQFVCAADETWRLQNGTGPECRFFQTFAVKGHYKGAGGTKQGYYVVAPSGKLLASANTRAGGAIVEMLEKGLAAWRELSPADRKLPDPATFRPSHRWEHSYPERGLVLERFARDLGGTDQRWNRDHAWFTEREARSMLPLKLAPGGYTDLARPLALRLARFHLVDNVRGQTLPFAPSEIEQAEIRLTITKRDGHRIELAIRGHTHANAKGKWLLGKTDWTPTQEYPRTLTTRLLGTARYDFKVDRFTSFELIALGTRTGRTGNCGRNKKDPPATPIGFYFRLAKPGVRIAPTFLEFYPAQWVKRPQNQGYGEHH